LAFLYFPEEVRDIRNGFEVQWPQSRGACGPVVARFTSTSDGDEVKVFKAEKSILEPGEVYESPASLYPAMVTGLAYEGVVSNMPTARRQAILEAAVRSSNMHQGISLDAI
jgi:hypothetical protein